MNKFRTLVRVTNIEENSFFVVIPGWDVHQEVEIKFEDVPEEIIQNLAIDKRFHVYTYLGATTKEGLLFSDWETK